MRLLIIVSIIIFHGCIFLGDEGDFLEDCPYDLKYGGHWLRVPVTISPHKLTYKIGDTINISTIFDSVYDLGTEQTYKIKNFPFKPQSLLFRVKSDGTHDSGFGINDLLIDSSYNVNYTSGGTHYAKGFVAHTKYMGGIYRFESQLVLKEKGRYVLLFSDLYESHDGAGRPELNSEANAITFEGKCPNLSYAICSMIDSGDDHLEQFEDELKYLDNEVYYGKLGSVEGELDIVKSGSIAVEFSGFFGFEVIE